MANSVDPDETSRSAVSHLGLYCLFCGISSGSILFAEACLSEYIWEIRYQGTSTRKGSYQNAWQTLFYPSNTTPAFYCNVTKDLLCLLRHVYPNSLRKYGKCNLPFKMCKCRPPEMHLYMLVLSLHCLHMPKACLKYRRN